MSHMTDREQTLSEQEVVGRNISYEHYVELGGIINEEDYRSALTRATNTFVLEKPTISQAEGMARFSGVSLDNSKKLDEVTVLYGVLRSDLKPGAEYHHGQMSDQKLFAETLRMLDRPEDLNKVIKTYPNIF